MHGANEAACPENHLVRIVTDCVFEWTRGKSHAFHPALCDRRELLQDIL